MCYANKSAQRFVFVFQGPPEEEHPDSPTASEGEAEDEDEEEEEEMEEKAKPLTATPCPPSQPLLIGSCSGFIETTVKIKQNDMLPGPKVCGAPSLQLGDNKIQLLSHN